MNCLVIVLSLVAWTWIFINAWRSPVITVRFKIAMIPAYLLFFIPILGLKVGHHHWIGPIYLVCWIWLIVEWLIGFRTINQRHDRK